MKDERLTDILGTSYSAISTAQTVLRTLPSTASSAARGKSYTDSLASDPFVARSARVSLNDTKDLLRSAIVAGETIVKTLEYLLDSAQLAGHDSLVSVDTNLLNGDGTRISQLNIQVAVERTLDAINTLVASASQDDLGLVNFISSKAFDLDIQTTDFGGSVKIAPQPLDTAGLNIDKLYLLSDSGIADAVQRLTDAIEVAQVRLLNIQNLQSTISSPDALVSGLSRYGTGSSGQLGAYVNLIA